MNLGRRWAMCVVFNLYVVYVLACSKIFNTGQSSPPAHALLANCYFYDSRAVSWARFLGTFWDEVHVPKRARLPCRLGCHVCSHTRPTSEVCVIGLPTTSRA